MTRRPIGGSSIKAQNARWHEIAGARDSLDVGRLLAALASGQVAAAARRVEVLGELPDDPRLASGLAAFLGVSPYFDSPTAQKLVAAARAIIARCAHRGVLDVLAPYAARPDVASLIDEVRAAVPAAREPDPRVTALRELLGGGDAEALLAAIFASPDDDGPRAVYADWLLEHGDDYGELINLQLRPELDDAAKARERELLARHERRIAAPFKKVSSDHRIRRGFVAACRLTAQNSRGLAASAVAPDWQTVEELWIAEAHLQPDALCLPVFRHVKRLHDVSPIVLEKLAFGPPRGIVRLGMYASESYPEQLAALAARDWPGLPHLTELVIQWGTPTMIAGLLGSPAAQRLHEVVVAGDEAWLPLMPASVRRVTLGPTNYARDGARWTAI